MSEAAVDGAIAALPLPADARILDTGCGSGEMVRRVLRLRPGACGVGIDIDADAIADVGSSHVHGGFPAALEALRVLAPVVLYGEGFLAAAACDGFSRGARRGHGG